MKRLFILLFALLPMLLSAQNLTVKTHPNKNWLYGYWGVKKNGKDGFVIKPKFGKAHPFVGEYAFVCYKGLWGIIGKDGKFVVAPKYSSASEPCNGITIVQLGSKYGLVKDGKIIVETKYKEILYLQNNTFAVYSNKFEFVNSEGKAVEQPNNVLLYTSKDGETIDRSRDRRISRSSSREHYGDYYWQVNVVSNTCHNGQGIMVFDKPITSIGYKAFYGCKSLTSITIPNSVTSIGYKAFAYCDGLTSITISDSVTSIGYKVFEGCTSLKRSNIHISDLARYCTSNPMHRIPGEAHLYLNGKEITNLVIPNSVTEIGAWAFENCTGLTSITIPDSVTEIGYSAFSGCDGLTSVTIPNSVTEIGERAFSGCENLKSITIPNSVTEIGDSAFYECCRLTSITIPDSVTSIGGSTFRGCRSLTSITIPNSVTEIRWSAFAGCESLVSVTIPNSVTEIGDEAFENCRNLTTVVLGNRLKSIGRRVFAGCWRLVNMTIPRSVTSIADDAFEACHSRRW